MTDTRAREEIEKLQRTVSELESIQKAIIEHLNLVLTRPYMGRYGAIWHGVSLREKCKECGK